MKRSTPPGSGLRPEDVGSQARERVIRWLAQAPLCPRDRFFDRIERLASLLALWGAHTNLTAHPDDPGETAFHIIDSLAPIAFAAGQNRTALEGSLAAGAFVLDIGAGAGFPALVLASAFDAHFTLVESRRKRASFLEVASREMELSNVTVERRRIPPQVIHDGFNLVTGRAFGPLPDFYRIAEAALRPNGIILVYASAGQELEVLAARAVGLIGPATWDYGVAHAERTTDRTAALWHGASSR